MKQAAGLGFIVIFFCALSLTTLAQEAVEEAESESENTEVIAAEDEIESEPIEEMYEEVNDDIEEPQEGDVNSLATEGFMEDDPIINTSPLPGGPLDELLRELTSMETLGGLSAVLFLLILLPLVNILRGQTPRKNTPHLALRFFQLHSEEHPITCWRSEDELQG